MFNHGQSLRNSGWATATSQFHEVPSVQTGTGPPTFYDTTQRPTMDFKKYISTTSRLPPTTMAQATSNAIAISEGWRTSQLPPTTMAQATSNAITISEGFHDGTRIPFPYLEGWGSFFRPEGSNRMGTAISSQAIAQIPDVRNPWLGCQECNYCPPLNTYTTPENDEYVTMEIPMSSIRVNRRSRSVPHTPNTTHSNYLSGVTDQNVPSAYENGWHHGRYDTNNALVNAAAQFNEITGETHIQRQAVPSDPDIPVRPTTQQRRALPDFWGLWDNRQTEVNNVGPSNSAPIYTTHTPTVTTRENVWVPSRLVEAPQTSATTVNNYSHGRVQENEVVTRRPVLTLSTQWNPQVTSEEAPTAAEQLQGTMYSESTSRRNAQADLSQPILLPTTQSKPLVVLDREQEIAKQSKKIVNKRSTSRVIRPHVFTQTYLQPDGQSNLQVFSDIDHKIAVKPQKSVNLRSTSRVIPQESSTQPVLLSDAQRNPQVVSEKSQKITEKPHRRVNSRSNSGVIHRELSIQTVSQPPIQHTHVVSKKAKEIAEKPHRTTSMRSNSGVTPKEVSAQSFLLSDAQHYPQVVTEIAQEITGDPQETTNLSSTSGENTREKDLAKTNHEQRGALKKIPFPEGQTMHFCSDCSVVYISEICLYEFVRQPPILYDQLCPCIGVHAGRSYMPNSEPSNPAQTEARYRLAAFTALIQNPSRTDEWLRQWGPYLLSTGGLETNHNCVKINNKKNDI